MSPDAFRLTWRLHVSAGDESAARRVAARLEAAMERPFRLESLEKYGKDPRLHVLVGWVTVDATDPAAAIADALTVAGRVAHQSVVGPPDVEEDGGVVLDGFASAEHQDFAVSGVQLAAWHLSRT